MRYRHSDRMDTEERKLRLHEIRVEILLQVGTDLAQTIKFSSRSIYPMLEDTRALRVVMEREMLDVDRLLLMTRERRSWNDAGAAGAPQFQPSRAALARGPGWRRRLCCSRGMFFQCKGWLRRGGDIGQLGGPSAHGHCRKGHWLRFCL